MKNLITLLLLLSLAVSSSAQKNSTNDKIIKIIDDNTGQYQKLYLTLHKNPELSRMEFNTSKILAEELKTIGFDVTTSVGGKGVVGVFRNGKGKVIMLRTDMDALPIKENTGLPFASTVVMKDAAGVEMPVMHACGHDLHMSIWLGTLKTLISLKEEWQGTVVAIAQPAEEISGGALGMIKDGLYKRFPLPDYALCYHVSPELPAGTVGYLPGPIFAGVNSVNMTIYGSGGHGAMPHTTIDPIVLSARIILDLQTIVSREINPVKPAVVTVGSIHGGNKHNIIPDEVKMLLTVRFYEDAVYQQIKAALIRIPRGIAISAGLPEGKMPLVEFANEYTPPVANNPELVITSVKSMRDILGQDKVVQVEPATVAEDFGQYGRTEEKIPIALFWIGGVNSDLLRQHVEKGTRLPPLHNSGFAPDFEPSFRGGVAAMTKALIDLYRKK
jgi:amidohydrolase